MLKKLKSAKQGFTIIEVLIVLAIAALILLIIFFAVPALQRNSRNTQLRNDAAVILGFVSDFVANNSGAVPTPGGSSYTSASGAITINNASGTATSGKIRGGVTVNFNQDGKGALTNTAYNQLEVDYGAKCSTTTAGATTTAGRATAVRYVIETSGNGVPSCLDS